VDLQDSNFWNTKLDVLSPVRNSLCVQGAVWGLLAACDNHHLQLQRIPPLRYALLWSRKLKLIVLIFDTFQSLSAICREKEVPGGGGGHYLLIMEKITMANHPAHSRKASNVLSSTIVQLSSYPSTQLLKVLPFPTTSALGWWIYQTCWKKIQKYVARGTPGASFFPLSAGFFADSVSETKDNY